jgi:hypothetical protein
MARTPRIVDALRPLDAITSVLAGILLTVFVLGGLATAFGAGITFFEVNGDEVCIDTHGSFGASSDVDSLDRDLYGLRKDVTTHPARTTLCDPHPDMPERVLAGLTSVPTFAVFAGFLLMTRRTIGYARRRGLFSIPLAERIERIGRLLLVGLLGAAVVEWLASGLLLDRLLTNTSWAGGSFSVSIAGIIGAVGLISIGRVMRQAAALQADADTTI